MTVPSSDACDQSGGTDRHTWSSPAVRLRTFPVGLSILK